MSEPMWTGQWIDYLGRILHWPCRDVVLFSAPDSEGTPTVARCSACGAIWRKAYGWQQERLTGLHREDQPEPPNLRNEEVIDDLVDPLARQPDPTGGWRVEIDEAMRLTDAEVMAALGRNLGKTQVSAECPSEGPPDPCHFWRVAPVQVVDAHQNVQSTCHSVRFNHGLLLLEPDAAFLAIAAPRAARAALSQHLGMLGDLAWAAWQKAHPEGTE